MTIQSFRLVMRAGPLPGQVYELAGDEIKIGRATTNEIIINEAEVSRTHVRIYQQAGGFVIEDLGSTNGTYLDGQRLLGPHVLHAGETILLGEKVSLEVEAVYDDDATLVPPPAVPPVQPSEPPPQTQQAAPPPTMPAQAVPEPAPPPVYTPVQEQPPAVQPAAQPIPTQPPVYTESGQDIPYEDQSPADNDKVPINWNWVFAGCGCMTIIACIVIVAGLFWIDTGGVDRWCQYLGFLFPACP